MIIRKLLGRMFSLFMFGCAHSLPPLKTVDRVDIEG